MTTLLNDGNQQQCTKLRCAWPRSALQRCGALWDYKFAVNCWWHLRWLLWYNQCVGVEMRVAVQGGNHKFKSSCLLHCAFFGEWGWSSFVDSIKTGFSERQLQLILGKLRCSLESETSFRKPTRHVRHNNIWHGWST